MPQRFNIDPYDEEDDLNSTANQPLIQDEDHDQIPDGKFPKARQVFAIVGFCGFAIVYAMRVNLSISVVSMVNHTAINVDTNQSITDVCPIPTPTNTSTPTRDGEFLWDEYSQGIVLGSFFYGYVLTQIPGGRLAETLGGKLVYGVGVFITALFTLLTPIAARKNLPALVLVRIFEGIGEGVTFPSMHAMLARWVPKTERSRFAAVVYNGANFGTIISIPLTGYLCSIDFMGGWPLSFYIFGLLGIFWCFFWWWYVFDTPESHPRISQEERLYIEKSLRNHDDELDTARNNDPVPWRAIATSAPMWALLITTCGQSWVFYTQLTELPSYMSNVLHFNIQQNAILSSLPYLTSWIFGIFCSIYADWLVENEYITQKNSLKLWNSVASIVPSIGLIGISWAGCDRIWVMIMLIGLGAFSGANYAAAQMNHLFLAPRYAGTLYGITNGAGNLCGFLAPYFIGSMINGKEKLETWSRVFYIAALINILCNFVFIAFGDAEEQSWSKRRSRDE
ncbi:CLUMA_CG005927, isoform A [Clunio marinus]|uniref:CLUMA_CG005927, isoform A n=1 Tax=Clunio marinus TaxID=568069 RepID=A0A1J1I0M6_9DIPT|nr:CLUMA_CG005927, isoform A [Clunio marinus]